MNRIVNRILEIDGGSLTSYTGDYGFYETSARSPRNSSRRSSSASRRCSPRRSAHRALQGSRLPCRAGAEAASRSSKRSSGYEPPKAPSDRGFRFPAAAALGRLMWRASRVSPNDMARRSSMTGLDFSIRRKERWCVLASMAWQIDLAQTDSPGRRNLIRDRSRSAAACAWPISPACHEVLDGEATVFGQLQHSLSAKRHRGRSVRLREA